MPKALHRQIFTADDNITRLECKLCSDSHLQVEEMPVSLQEELKAFHHWCTARFYGQQHVPIAEVTAKKYLDHLRCGVIYLYSTFPRSSAGLNAHLLLVISHTDATEVIDYGPQMACPSAMQALRSSAGSMNLSHIHNNMIV